MKRAVVVGAGVGGLSAAAVLAKAGYRMFYGGYISAILMAAEDSMTSY
ncbi:MAG: hypothetical protein QME21_19695 [Anaerolineales bacterium]|nr:hypothetical protein [Anaerolineales bacterium]